MSTYVTHTVRDGIAEVRMARPDKLNALTLETLEQLVATARELGRDRTLRAVVLAGEGESFCAGLDFGAVLRDRPGIVKAFIPRSWRGTNLFQEAAWAWRRLPVPVIAAVRGHCYGGGLQIALAADFRIATPDSRWSVMEGRWGIIPDMTGLASLKQVVGADVGKLLTMTARVLSGEEAHGLGLATQLDADPEKAALSLAEEISARSPDSVAAAKRLVDSTWARGPRATFARERFEQLRLLATKNTSIALKAAFAEGPPAFGPRSR